MLDNINLARKLVFEKNDPASVAKFSLYAAAFPSLLTDYKSHMERSTKEIESLKKQVADLSAVQPTTPTASKQTDSGTKVPIQQVATSPAQASREWFKRTLAARNE